MTSLRYRLGDTGPDVAEIRSKLAQLGLLDGAPNAAGVFDGDMDEAVRHFQQDRGLTVTGVVDATTHRALDEARWRLGDRLLSYAPTAPQTGDDVVSLQHRLSELGFDVGRLDGVFGPRTHAAVGEFQRNIGLPADGECGPATFQALSRLAPLVTGGQPESLRAVESLRQAGKQLLGKAVVIDPGHGGADRGHVGRGLDEASLVEDLAARVDAGLTATGARTARTRDAAAGTPLSEVDRAAVANRFGADLVISLHVDAHHTSCASGVATYYYGNGRPGAVSTIGQQFASLVQREIVARTGLLDCRTHAKTWDLLRHTRMPAVRVELGYITNERDAERLADASFRNIVAEAVVVAVQRLYLPDGEDAATGVLRFHDLATR